MMPDCREKFPNMAMTFEAETQECALGGLDWLTFNLSLFFFFLFGAFGVTKSKSAEAF
jgi:hypothetical protein